MNILQIFASSFWGGGEQYVYDLSSALIKDGHRVTFFSRKSTIIPQKVSGFDAEYHQLPFKSIFSFYSAYKLSRYLRNNLTDVIHIHCFKTMLCAILAKKLSGSKAKIILTRHLIKKGKNNFLYRWAYKRLSKVVFVSRISEQTFLDSVPHFPQKTSVVIHNSIPSIENLIEQPVSIREKYNIPAECPLIFFVGRVVPEKGIVNVIEAFAKLKQADSVLVIVGSGDEAFMNHLHQMVDQYKLTDSVLFMGYNNNARQLMKEADLGVVPSICKESFGLSVAEFMQAGKCVITTNNGAQVEFVNHGENGWLVGPDNTDELVNAFDTLIHNDKLRKRIGEDAQKYFDEHLSYTHFYNNILQVYQA